MSKVIVQTRETPPDIYPALIQRWASVSDAGPALNQRWADVSLLLGSAAFTSGTVYRTRHAQQTRDAGPMLD